MRPSQTYGKASKDFKYLPNSVYPYTRVKQTLLQTLQLNIKPSRYWNELLLKDVPEDILYSLSDYCPGMPESAIIVNDNATLGLPLFRPTEAEFGLADHTGRKTVCANGTIRQLVELRAIPNDNQATLESYLISVQEMINKYDQLFKNWPFLIALRLLQTQGARLRHIKSALTERINSHPLASANCATFNPNLPVVIPSALAAQCPPTFQNGGIDNQSQQSANRSGYENRSGRGQ